MTCGVEPCVLTIVCFSFLSLLQGPMGPEGEGGPPGVQGLRVSELLPASSPAHPHQPRLSSPDRGGDASLVSWK